MSTQDSPHQSTSPGYQLFILVLSLYALALLAVQTLVHLDPQAREVLEYTDVLVCVAFLGDFAWSFYRAPNRLRYFATWGWIDILSSIPSIDVARWGRAARVLRVFRLLRGLRAARSLSSLILERRAENTILAVTLVALMVVTFCSIAVLHVETDPASNIKSADDAVWWAITTMTTVGYGDRFPVTTEGRFVAVLLMASGVGLFGTLSGLLAAWLIGPSNEREKSEIAELKQELAALRQAIERLANKERPAS